MTRVSNAWSDTGILTLLLGRKAAFTTPSAVVLVLGWEPAHTSSSCAWSQRLGEKIQGRTTSRGWTRPSALTYKSACRTAPLCAVGVKVLWADGGFSLGTGFNNNSTISNRPVGARGLEVATTAH